MSKVRLWAYVFLTIALLSSCVHIGETKQDSSLDMPDTLQEVSSAEKDAAESADAQVLLTLEMFCEMVENGTFSSTDYLSFSNGVIDPLASDPCLNYYVRFPFNYQGDVITVEISLRKDTDEIEAIYIRRESTHGTQLLYSSAERFTADLDIQSFLTNTYDIRKEISYQIPEGLNEDIYDARVGYGGGYLLTPNAYELHGDSSGIPAEWIAGGSVCRFHTDGCLTWDGDTITDVFLMSNNASTVPIGPVEGLAAPGFLVNQTYYLYSLGQWGALEEAGIDVQNIESSSEYWEIFLARPGDEIGYVVSLNAKNYTQLDAISFAESLCYLK